MDALAASLSLRPILSLDFGKPVRAVSVSAIPAEQLGGVAQRGLDVLMELIAKIDGLDSHEPVAQAAVDAVREATLCRRVVVVESEAESEISVLASTSAEPPKVSCSLDLSP